MKEFILKRIGIVLVLLIMNLVVLAGGDNAMARKAIARE